MMMCRTVALLMAAVGATRYDCLRLYNNNSVFHCNVSVRRSIRIAGCEIAFFSRSLSLSWILDALSCRPRFNADGIIMILLHDTCGCHSFTCMVSTNRWEVTRTKTP